MPMNHRLPYLETTGAQETPLSKVLEPYFRSNYLSTQILNSRRFGDKQMRIGEGQVSTWARRILAFLHHSLLGRVQL